MKILTLVFVLLSSLSLNAASIDDVNVTKYTDSLDYSFFQDCLDNTEPKEGMLSCRVFQAPEGTRILKDAGLLAALNFTVVWSNTHCSINNRDAGLLYLRTKSTYADIYFHDVRCVEIMRDAVIKSENFSNKSLYLIKEDN